VATDDGRRRGAARLCGPLRVTPMAKGHKQTSPRKRGGHGAAANKRAADLHAKSLAPTILNLQAAGLSGKAIRDELTKRNVSTVRGGAWHITTVKRLLARLS
jgi:hypothetical protein